MNLSFSLIITGGNLYDKILRQKDKLFEEEVIWAGLREQWGWPNVLGICLVICVLIQHFFRSAGGEFVCISGDWYPSSPLEYCKHLLTIRKFCFPVWLSISSINFQGRSNKGDCSTDFGHLIILANISL